MTIITPGSVLPVTEPSSSPRSSAAVDTGFRIPSAQEMPHPGATDAARTAPAVSTTRAMLAHQEQTGSDAGYGSDLTDREARRHGQEILDALAALQRALLRSGDPAEGLARLRVLAEMAPVAHDPTLARVLSSIRLRAQLEVLRRAPRPLEQRNPPAAAIVAVPANGS